MELFEESQFFQSMSDFSNPEDSISSLYHAFRAQRRRRVIQYLQGLDEPVVEVRFLARKIAAAEHELPIENATGEPYRNAYNALSQTHLPTLAEAGIVIYDPKRQTVSQGQNLGLASLLLALNETTVGTLDEVEIRHPSGPV